MTLSHGVNVRALSFLCTQDLLLDRGFSPKQSGLLKGPSTALAFWRHKMPSDGTYYVYYATLCGCVYACVCAFKEREKKFVLPLEGLKQRGGDTSFFSRRPNFCIFHPDPKVNVFKEFKTLDLAADNVESRDNWKGALLRAGVFPEKAQQPTEDEKVRISFLSDLKSSCQSCY